MDTSFQTIQHKLGKSIIFNYLDSIIKIWKLC